MQIKLTKDFAVVGDVTLKGTVTENTAVVVDGKSFTTPVSIDAVLTDKATIIVPSGSTIDVEGSVVGAAPGPIPVPPAGGAYPAAPQGLSASYSGGTTINVSWPAQQGAYGYNVFRDGKYLGSVGTTNFNDKSFTPGASHSYEITSYDTSGVQSPKSVPFMVASPATPGPQPPLPAGTDMIFPASFWAQKTNPAAKIHAQSAAMVAELAKNFKGKPGYWGDPWINAGSVAAPVYIVKTNIPKVKVRLVLKGTMTTDTGRPLLSARLAQGIRIPANAVTATGTDHQMAVWDMVDGSYFDGWLMSKDPQNPGGWVAVNAGVIDQAATSDGRMPSFAAKNGEWWGSTATKLPLGAGLITMEDLQAGVIDHMLAVAIPFPNNKFVYPAQASDGNGKTVGQPLYSGGPVAPWTSTIAEGQIFRLPAGFVVDPAAPPLVKMINTALRDYGKIIVDYAGAGVFGSENPLQYGVQDMLKPYMAGKQLWDLMPMIPIDKMEALA